MSTPLIFTLTGAPGSGKTAVASLFHEKVCPHLDERGVAPATLIDCVPDEVANAGLPVGIEGFYVSSLAILHRRVYLMAEALSAGQSVIMCGSIFDCMAHVQTRINMLGIIQTPNTQAQAAREVVAAQLFGAYVMDGVSPYNFIWYLPKPPSISVPGQDDGTFTADIDAAIRDMNVRMGLGLEVLTGTTEERADQMVESFLKSYHPVAADADS